MMTILDFYSRHMQAIPLKDKWAERVGEALAFQVLLEQGVPEILYSDKGNDKVHHQGHQGPAQAQCPP